MKIEKINIGRGRKISRNYNSQDYHVGIEVNVEKDDNIITVYETASNILTSMENIEAKRIIEGLKK